MSTEEIFQQVMNENCKDPLHRFAELVRQDEREREWIGLSDSEAEIYANQFNGIRLVKGIEALLKERNT